MESSDKDLLIKLQGEKDWHKSIVFTDKFNVITSNNCVLKPEEIEFYTLAYDDRDKTVGEGFFVNDEHFDVHRFHPPLIYGRRGGPDDGEGIAICRVTPKNPKHGEKYWFLLITYLLPILSAKAVP
mmetsp:Transcript_31664/g.23471  ORF Transcript_31664/g.23471 Transcript_31664/m.23471 type:complete len:126 (-) Transcript_31664:73-450(-)|eukprot:CAMPEP_0202967666 /NCGR_PEP_ID=MMETSP1396-20130829/12644_1 /ASSEMBLY_ACC=CAM_ASM_000872 /TAXON_ID= /ORGANISM="Pseudokeronopsis sp., Strain Brazil" /LENGTH=125 /DNA_ID=CAMNT_0049693015 /DNA_START=35 /DNA_END=412 /DNA_ORIENTATION=+